MAKKEEQIQMNRTRLREWFIDNPKGSLHAGLNTALKNNHALGLTKDIASMLHREAAAELKTRAEAAETKAAVEAATKHCVRCKAVGHFASECTVELAAPTPPPPPPKLMFKLGPEDHVDAPETQLRMLQFVLLEFANDGLVTTLSGARDLGECQGQEALWRRAFETLHARGLLERAEGTTKNSAHLWAVHAGREADLRTLADDGLKLAGLLWHGSGSEPETEEPPPASAPAHWTEGFVPNMGQAIADALLPPSAPSAPLAAPASAPAAPISADRFDALFNLMEANLAVSQGIFNLLMAARTQR